MSPIGPSSKAITGSSDYADDITPAGTVLRLLMKCGSLMVGRCAGGGDVCYCPVRAEATEMYRVTRVPHRAHDPRTIAASEGLGSCRSPNAMIKGGYPRGPAGLTHLLAQASTST